MPQSHWLLNNRQEAILQFQNFESAQHTPLRHKAIPFCNIQRQIHGKHTVLVLVVKSTKATPNRQVLSDSTAAEAGASVGTKLLQTQLHTVGDHNNLGSSAAAVPYQKHLIA
jgi:hypothetical protein